MLIHPSWRLKCISPNILTSFCSAVGCKIKEVSFEILLFEVILRIAHFFPPPWFSIRFFGGGVAVLITLYTLGIVYLLKVFDPPLSNSRSPLEFCDKWGFYLHNFI